MCCVHVLQSCSHIRCLLHLRPDRAAGITQEMLSLQKGTCCMLHWWAPGPFTQPVCIPRQMVHRALAFSPHCQYARQALLVTLFVVVCFSVFFLCIFHNSRSQPILGMCSPTPTQPMHCSPTPTQPYALQPHPHPALCTAAPPPPSPMHCSPTPTQPYALQPHPHPALCTAAPPPPSLCTAAPPPPSPMHCSPTPTQPYALQPQPYALQLTFTGPAVATPLLSRWDRSP